MPQKDRDFIEAKIRYHHWLALVIFPNTQNSELPGKLRALYKKALHYHKREESRCNEILQGLAERE